MNPFDHLKEDFEHSFVRSNLNYLRQICGAEDVTPYWVADMDFEVAAPITRELQRLVERGIYAYEFNSNEVYCAVIDWYKRRHNLTLEKEAFVSVPSVLSGISMLIRELTEPGDGVLIQTPVYHQFAQLIKTAQRKVVLNPLKISNDRYEIDFVDLEQKLQTDKVKVILLCNPHNPVGRVWRQTELEQLVALANSYGVTIISDEIHADIVYSGHLFHSIMSVDAYRHIAVIGSPAKTFGLQSFANGYLYIPAKEAFQKLHELVEAMYLNHGNVFATFATIAAYRHGAPWVDSLITYLETTIASIQDYLARELPKVKMFPVEGTYQIWIDFSELFANEAALKKFIAHRAKLGLAPGGWFGPDSSLFMRMNIASPLTKIQQSLKQLAAAYKELEAK